MLLQLNYGMQLQIYLAPRFVSQFYSARVEDTLDHTSTYIFSVNAALVLSLEISKFPVNLDLRCRSSSFSRFL